jgi:hypothetical protein
LKEEWRRLGVEVHDRAVGQGLPNSEYREILRRMEEIEHRHAALRSRAHVLRKTLEKLDEYEAEGVFELAI